MNKLKNYYAKHKGRCFGFQDRKLLSCALNTYGFESLKQPEALRQFGYTNSCSRYVIDYQAISSEEELRSIVMQYAERITVKRITVEAFLDAAKERASFSKNTVLENGANYVELLKRLDELKDAEKLKAQELFKESGDRIPGSTFVSLASAAYGTLGLDDKANKAFYKMLTSLGVEVTK